MYKILIADDEEIIGTCLEKMIDWKKIGTEVIGVALDGEEALEIFREKMPDIVILDINMPFINGIELAGIIHKERPDTKVIMLTAYKEFEYAQQAIKYQVVDYLTKPFNNDDVKAVVEKIIEDWEKSQEKKKDSNEEKNETITDRIISYIKKNYQDPELNLKSTAEALFISTSYVQTLLKNRQTSFSKLLDEIRMKKAMELLKKEKDLKVYEVAYMVGLNSSQYFSKKFKQFYGVEPKTITKSRNKNEK